MVKQMKRLASLAMALVLSLALVPAMGTEANAATTYAKGYYYVAPVSSKLSNKVLTFAKGSNNAQLIDRKGGFLIDEYIYFMTGGNNKGTLASKPSDGGVGGFKENCVITDAGDGTVYITTWLNGRNNYYGCDDNGNVWHYTGKSKGHTEWKFIPVSEALPTGVEFYAKAAVAGWSENKGYLDMSLDSGSSYEKQVYICERVYNNRNQNQRWKLEKADKVDGVQYYYIVNVRNNEVLDVEGGNAYKGCNVITYPKKSKGTENQQWAIEPYKEGGGYFSIRSRLGSNWYLDVSGAGKANRTNVQIWEQNHSVAQMWRFIDA